ncbi:MAG: Polyprenol monophosphomannose synthase [Candidatus Dichloromethanomonas elyunquensis]|nr:MAG: Polyprenol monophosphomannose synthase [Candidatus Dichloromethanomonas elyunquensis]
MNKLKIAIIIPAHNEEMIIQQVIESVQKAVSDSTIIVIDDGSMDNTYAKAKSTGAITIRLAVNLGIGGAVQTGLIYAAQHGFDYAVQVDGDGQHDPKEIIRLLRPLILNQADLVIGSRYIEKSGFQSTFLRRIGSRYLNDLIYLITGLKITDSTSGFRACNSKIIHEFAKKYPKDYPEPESIVFLKRKGYVIQELPVKMKERPNGSSSINPYKSIYYMIKVSAAIVIEAFRQTKYTKGL